MGAENPKLELVSAEKIWDAAPHNAFTDLIRYKDRWVCAFREASAHKGGTKDSTIRVIVSDDAKTWEPIASLKDDRGDIRDAKLAILPDGRLLLLTAIQLFDQSKQTHQSIAFITSDLKTWDGPIDVGQPNFWLWGIEFHDGVGYSIGYGTTNANRFVRLFKTTDGVKFEPIVEHFDVNAKFPNESAMLFDDDGTARVLLREEPSNYKPDNAEPAHAFIGTAKAPYTDWTWKEANVRVGGPALTRAPGGHLLAITRWYQPKVHTELSWLDPETATLTEALSLPSGGDTSYAGSVWYDGMLYISYYSSHEGKTSIYFAKVKLSDATTKP